MNKLKIELADRSYEILIGQDFLSRSSKILGEVLKPSRIVVVTHPSIRSLYGDRLVSSFVQDKISTDIIEVPEGERSKSLQQAEKIYDRLMEINSDRKTLLVALGGGVIGDLTGFVAATYQRGIPFMQVPTTLLSQVDSSVGGKTAVNHPRGKNMIGAFYQPCLVLIDLATLKTLPDNEFRAGLAEIIKHGVITDPELFQYLEDHVDQIQKKDPDCLEHIITTSCAIKAKVVERDERESHYRMILNFGHTFGHAVESLTGYSTFIHGEAVAMGMVKAADLSVLTGRCSEEVAKRIVKLLDRFGLPTRLPDLEPRAMVESMQRDKKTIHKKLRFVLIKEIGSVEIVDTVSEEDVLQVLMD
jgi:3-dehydroquinate synthase